MPTILRQGRVQPIWAVIALGLDATTMSVDLACGRIVGSLAAVILVVMVYGVSSEEPKRGSFGWAAERLGDYSYALYLIHVPVTLLVLANLQATRRFSARNASARRLPYRCRSVCWISAFTDGCANMSMARTHGVLLR
ncbi:hypothetical protein IGS74_14300 [Aureimonas sp. OT7]|uniref:hypothetical protein n=1 Tax=Aureimonas sp. OT7 TaxID=2816454 RepID=UPI001782B8F0|nr:hypothetical protein [Aureimonas sp. OT7]QOG05745.1 hypothetical protein IGS74_14300 [Aureimonas sp. OT7]